MKTKTWVAMLALYLIWGSTYLGIRFTIETIPPFFSGAVRFLAAGLILLAWRRLAGDPIPTARQIRSAGIVGLFLLLGGNGLVAWAEQSIPSGVAALMIGSTPMWLVGIEALRPGGVRPHWQAVLGLVVGFGGIALLVGPGQLSGTIHIAGVLAILAATFLWACGSIYSRSADMPESILMGSAIEMLIGSLGMFVVSGLLGEFGRFSLQAVSVNSWLGLLYLITIGSLGGFVAYSWLLRNAPISLVSTYAYVNPVVAVFLGAWLAAEILNTQIFIAAGVIIGAVILINTTQQAKK